MKKISIYLLLLLPAFVFCSCEKDMETYHAAGNDRINFVFEDYYHADTLISHTFVYYPESRQWDTLWMEMETSGFVTDYPRTIPLIQLPVDSNAAIAGIHYIAFDDPSLKDVYVVPANQSKVKIPLIVKRDPTLKKKEYVLKIGIAENEHFKTGFEDYKERTFRISDILTRPKNWTGNVSWYCFGKYGPKKYQFMIEVGAARGIVINEDFFKGLVPQNPPDMAYCDYWGGIFRDALNEENAARAAEGKDVLREDPLVGEAVGQEIYFKSYTDNK